MGQGWLEVLERLSNVLWAELRQAAAARGLQPVHAQVIHYLARCNRYSNTPGAVGEYLGLTKGTVSQSLLLLTRKGLLRRQADTADRRVVRLELSAEGRRVAADLFPPGVFRRAVAPAGAEAAMTSLLVTLQQAQRRRTFGLCASCRHYHPDGSGAVCGLTGERLSASDARCICREHEPAALQRQRGE